MTSQQRQDAISTPAGQRLAEELNLTDDDLSDMSRQDLEQASAKLKEVKAVLNDADKQ